MDESIRQGVVGITLAFVVGAAYILEMKLNDVYREGFNRDKELSYVKQRNEELEVKVETSESELSSLKTAVESSNAELSLLKTTMEKLTDEMKEMMNTPPGKYISLYSVSSPMLWNAV
jgi:uncharacterized coiled-coil protein SlyX